MHGPSVWKPCTSLQGFLFGQLLLALSTVAVIQFILLRGPLGGARTETTQLREKRRAVLRRLESSSESGSRVTGTSTGVSGADLASATSAADISTVLALLDGELLDVLKYGRLSLIIHKYHSRKLDVIYSLII